MPQLEDLRQRYILDTYSVKREAKGAASAVTKLRVAARKAEAASRRHAAALKKEALALRLIKSVAREVQSAYRLALRRFGAAAVAALVLSLGKATVAAAKFQKEMAEVSTLVDTASVSMRELSMNLLGIAKSTPVGLSDLTKGLYQVISASVPAGRAVEFLGVASKAAVAGVTSVATAVDGMTTVLNAWGKDVSEATDIADTFFVTVRDGKTTFEELSKNIGTVAPNAAALGVTFEETSAAMAAMTLQGLSTDKAAVALRGFFSAVINPGQQALETANALGLAWGEQAIKSKGLVGFLAALREATKGNTKALSQLVPNVRAVTGVNAILGIGFEDLNRIMSDMEMKALAMEDAYSKMRRTTSGMWDLFKNQFNVAMIELGNKILPSVNEGLQSMLNWLADMRDPTDALINRLRDLGAEAAVLAELTALNNLQIAGRQVAELRSVEGGGFIRRGPGVQPREEFGGTFVVKADATAVDEMFDKITTRAHDLSTAFEEPEEALEKIDELFKLTRDRINEVAKAERELLNGNDAFIDGIKVTEESLKEETEALDDQVTKLLDAKSAITLLVAARRTLKNIEEGRGDVPSVDDDDETVTTPSISTDKELEKAIEAFEKYSRELVLARQKTEELRDAHELLFERQDQLRKLAEAEAVLFERRDQAAKEIGRLEALRVNLIMQGVSESDKQIKNIDEQIALKKEFVVVENRRLIVARALRAVAEDHVKASKLGLSLQYPSAALQARMANLQSKLSNSTEKWAESMARVLTTIGDITSLFGALGKDMQGLIEGAAQIVTHMETLDELQAIKNAGESVSQAAQATATLGVIGGVVSIGSSLVSALSSNEEEQRRLRDSFNRSMKSIEDYTEALLRRDIQGGNLTADQRDLARNARVGLETTDLTTGRQILRNLVNQGIIDEAFVELLDQLRDTIPNFVPDDTVWSIFLGQSGILDVLDDVVEGLGDFGKSLDGARKAAELAGTFGTEQDQLNAFLNELLKLDISDELRGQIEGGFDLSTDAGRASLRAFVEALVASLMASDERFLGGQLTSDDIDDLKDFLVEFIPDEGSIDGISRSVQIQRTITEIQANELIAIQESALLTLERILDAIRMQDASGNTYNISIDIPADTTDFGRRILEEIEQEIRLKEAS